MEKVYTFVAGVGKGGVRYLGVGGVLCCGGSGGTYLRVIDMVCVPTHWEDAVRIPPLGGLKTYRTEDEEEAG